MNRICVFCGSRTGNDPAYQQAATTLGRHMAENNQGLVFGGGSVGLMGVLADVILENDGEVIGVIPEALATKELLHTGVTKMHRVNNMHERKAMMFELSEAFIALPGGLGTFEEFFEIVTWAQLGMHRKSIGLLNVNGYFDPLVQLIDHSIEAGFVNAENRNLIVVDDDPEALLSRLAEHELPPVRRWLGLGET